MQRPDEFGERDASLPGCPIGLPDRPACVPTERDRQTFGPGAPPETQMLWPGQAAPFAPWGKRQNVCMGIMGRFERRVLVAMDHHNDWRGVRNVAKDAADHRLQMP